MTLVDKKEINIVEALEFLKSKGNKNAEKRLQRYLRDKKLATNPKKSTIEDLQQYYNYVELTSGGQNGTFILANPKETPSERQDGRKDNERKIKREFEILDEYFLYRLNAEAERIGENNVMKTMGAWTSFIFGNWILADSFVSAYRTRMEELLDERMDEQLITDVKSHILQQLNEMMYSNMKTIINRHDKNGAIEKSSEQFAKYTKENFEMINQIRSDCGEMELKNPFTPLMANELIPIKKDIAKIFKSYGLKPSRYETLAAFPQYCTSPEEKHALNEAKVSLHEKGYQFYFNNHRIFPLVEVDEVNTDEAKKAYFTWIIERTESRMKKYKDSIYMKEVLFNLGIYILLDIAGCERVGIHLKDKIESIISSLPELINEAQSRYAIEKGTQPYEPEPFTGHGFGELAIIKKEPKPIFTEEEIEQLLSAHKPAAMKVNDMDIQQIQEVQSMEVKPMSKELDWLNRIAPKRERKDELSPERAARIKEIAEQKSGLIDMDALLDEEPIKQKPKPVKRFGADLFAAAMPECPEPFDYDEVLDIPDEVKEIWAMEAAQQYEYDLAFAV